MSARFDPIVRRFVAAAAMLLALVGAAPAQDARTDRITIAYDEPKDDDHKPVLAMLRERRVLENMRTMLSPLRLPKPLAIRTAGCEGEVNAWFDTDTVTLCYEYVAWIVEVANKSRRPIRVSDEASIDGPLVEVLVHEAAHAIFDYLDVPILGREEDAADQLAALWILTNGRDRTADLVAAIVNLYLDEAGVKRLRQLTRPRLQFGRATKYSDAHSLPVQRMYNLVCLAYGAHPVAFDAIRRTSGLPEDRAEGCADEHRQVTRAYLKLIHPHVDPDTARRVYGPDWPRGGK